MKGIKISTCCTCGHTWVTGENGSHSCSSVMSKLIARLEKERQLLLDRAAISVCNSQMVHNQIIIKQSAVIDAVSNNDANKGMVWIKNSLMGPGHLGAALDQVDNNISAQAHFDKEELPILAHKEYVAKVETWLKDELAK